MICGKCRECCKDGELGLHPEHGDDPSTYQTEIRGGRIMLAKGPSGACVYLGDGCTIYERRPVECRVFDCRAYAAMNLNGRNRQERRKVLASHPNRAVLRIGVKMAASRSHPAAGMGTGDGEVAPAIRAAV